MFRTAHRSASWRRTQATGAVLVVVAFIAAGCGSGNKSTSSGGSTTSAPASGATTTAVSNDAALGTPNKATGTPIKIGFFNVEGGSTVSIPEIGDAAEATAKYANDYLGGVGGHPIQVVRCADKADGASATACANQFVQEKVAAVVTGQPAQSDQMVPIVTQAGIPYIGASPTGSAETLTAGPAFLAPGFLGTLSAWASYAKDKGYKKFGIFLVDNPQATAAVNALGSGLFKKVNVELQVNVIPQGTADATSQVQAGVSKSPDVVAIVGDATVCQAVVSALKTAGSTTPIIGITPCLTKSVLDALGKNALDGMLIFDSGDTVSNDKEAQLFRAVMKKYAPSLDTSGQAPTGYLSMLGFARAVNAGGLTGDPTAASVTAAVKAAKNVPLPAGRGETFSCDASAIKVIIKSTICNSKLFLTSVKAGKETGDFKVIDSAPLFNG